MKKIAKYLLFIMFMESVLVCFSGCNIEDFKRHRNENSDSDIIITDEGDTKYQKEFGTYIVKSGWVESKTHSQNGKYFYVKDGQDNDSRPNNISINAGTNKYKKEEHEKFREAIYAQLARQVGSNVTINATGSTTDKGELVYTFVINNSNLVSTQYYIIGEKKYVMIYETVWNNDEKEETDEVALKMINSFEWKE